MEDELLAAGVLETSNSQYMSAVHLARKKGPDLWRYTVDLRALNKQLEPSGHPLPTCQELIDRLSGASWFTTLDLKGAYWQVELAHKFRHMTAFESVNHGLVQFARLPMGIVVAAGEFQQRMENVLRGMVGNIVLVYQDDLIVFSKQWDDHVQDLRRVLIALKEANVTLNLDKCFFARVSVSYLGFRISAAGVAADKALLSKITTFHGPLSFDQTRSFLGTTVMYRRFVYRYADRCKPLRDAVQAASKGHKEVKGIFLWTDECEKALRDLQEALSSAPVCRLPDANKPFTLFTDASGYALGCVLCQKDEATADFVVVLYDSIAFLKQQRIWNTSEKEVYAVVHFLFKYQHYLDNGLTIQVFTDHSAVKGILESQENKGKLLRWALALAEFAPTLQITHWPGHAMPADFFSRHPQWLAQEKAQLQSYRLRLVQDTNSIPICALDDEEVVDFNISREFGIAFAKLQRECTEVGKLFPIAESAPKSKYVILADGLLFRQSKGVTVLVIPVGFRLLVLQLFHESKEGMHLKGARFVNALKERVWWEGMEAEALDWCNSCEICQYFDLPHGKPIGFRSFLPAAEPFSLTAMDIVGPLPETASGHRYFLTFVDYASRWAEAVPLKDKSASEVAKAFIEQILCRWGAPLRILTDCDKTFTGKVLRTVSKVLSFGMLVTTPYHPQADGMTERLNGTLIRLIAKYVQFNQLDWDVFLPHALFVYRSSVHRATGVSPFQAITGLTPRNTLDASVLRRGTQATVLDLVRLRKAARDVATINDEASRQSEKERQNAGRLPNPFKVGDIVVRKRFHLNDETVKKGKKSPKKRIAKLAPKYSHPMRVIEVNGNRLKLTSLDQRDRNREKFVDAEAEHCKFFRLPALSKKYLGEDDLDSWLHPKANDESREFTARQVVGHEDQNDQRKYWILWEGFEEQTHRTLEDLGNLEGALELVLAYERQLLASQPEQSHFNRLVENDVGELDPLSALMQGQATNEELSRTSTNDVGSEYRLHVESTAPAVGTFEGTPEIVVESEVGERVPHPDSVTHVEAGDAAPVVLRRDDGTATPEFFTGKRPRRAAANRKGWVDGSWRDDE